MKTNTGKCPRCGNKGITIKDRLASCDVCLNCWETQDVKSPFDITALNGARRAVFGLMIAVSLVVSIQRTGWLTGTNWQLMQTAVVTSMNGGNPYLPSEFQLRHPEVNFTFPYAAIWLPPIAAIVVLGQHQIVLFLLFIAGLFLLPRSFKERELAGSFALSLCMTLSSGNIAVLEFALMAWVFRLMDEQKADGAGMVLGVMATMKLLPLAFVAALPTWKARATGIAAFVLAIGAGMLAVPRWAGEYVRCLAGVHGNASVTSELRISGMDNQAIYQHGPVVAVVTALIIVGAGVWLWSRTQSATGKSAAIILTAFLLFPRIPPHAFLAYAAVPTLALYQELRSGMRWFAVFIVVLGAWLLFCRAFDPDMPASTQYWTTFSLFLLFALNKIPHSTLIALKEAR